MTNAEQTTVNELAGLTRSLTGEISALREEVTGVRHDLRVLQDDKVARDAVAASRTEDWKRIVAYLGVGVTAAAMLGNFVARAIFGS